MRTAAKMLLSLFCLAALPSLTWSNEESLSIDLLGGAAGSRSQLSDTGTTGFSVFGDWRPDRAIAFGVAVGYLHLNGWGLKTSWVDVGGRLYPLKPFSFGETYLQGSMGFNPLYKKDTAWNGKIHGNVGVGLNCPLSGNRSLDMGLGYDVFNPGTGPLNSISLKVGICWTFGKLKSAMETESTEAVSTPKQSPLDAPASTTQSKATPAVQTIVKADASSPSVQTYTWVDGDNLRSISKALYGERDLYPILVDANTDKYRRPSYLVPGAVLTIPVKITAKEKVEARMKSRQDGYKLWGKWGETKKK
jgi:hypothetical protein